MNIATECFDLKPLDEPARREIYRKAGEIIRRGGTVVFPTETVYGLGADAMNEEAVRSIYAAKGRPSDNPLIIHIADGDLTGLVAEVPETARRLMSKYWPGPLTIIMKKAPQVPDATTGALDTVGIRMPDQPAARGFLKACRCPVAAPSANISGRPSPTTYQRCIEDLFGRVDMILGFDQSRVGLESTIVDVTGTVPELLRPGAITLEMLRETLGEVIYRPLELLGENETPRAPGMKYRHYAPRARVVIFRGRTDDVRRRMLDQKEQNTLLVFIDENDRKPEAETESREDLVHFKDLEEAAHGIFETLRRADDKGFREIYIQAVAETGLGLSLMNRLKKAAAFDIVEVR